MNSRVKIQDTMLYMQNNRVRVDHAALRGYASIIANKMAAGATEKEIMALDLLNGTNLGIAPMTGCVTIWHLSYPGFTGTADFPDDVIFNSFTKMCEKKQSTTFFAQKRAAKMAQTEQKTVKPVEIRPDMVETANIGEKPESADGAANAVMLEDMGSGDGI